MRLEDEIKTQCFQSEEAKAKLNVMFTASWLHARISAMLKEFGISHEQFNVLHILRNQHPQAVAQKEILHRMLERNSNLTRILSKLKSKGLVNIQRSDDDRREYQISLSAEAIPFLDHIHTTISNHPCSLHGLSVSECFHLNALLDKMREVK